ncbi:hypothetical protein PHET_01777 [Paragonimus heterotremus]|uniref:Uncharacterized protein n=1 Tax=Paragonimus heterotremus TaxID=100268 RepID=A0A8J4ST91_9TREM|nr:hypothetical protein PHET_01777 [Paragonimus heterotremus]
MSEYCEQENSCVRCLRSSPIASLLGLVLVLIGGGAFAGGTIFARRYLINLVNEPELFPYLDYVVYLLIGAIGLFSLVAYLLCALSSGRNAKHCFESSRKSACGRCCNMTLILCLVLGLLLWTATVCVMTYPVMSIALLLHRDSGPSRLYLSTMNIPILSRDGRSPTLARLRAYSQTPRLQRLKRSRKLQLDDLSESLPSSNAYDEFAHSDFKWPDQPDSVAVPSMPVEIGDSEMGSPGSSDLRAYPDHGASSTRQHGNEILNETARLGMNLHNQIPQLNIPDVVQSGTSLARQGLAKFESLFFKCDQDSLDLSYYGLYDSKGMPIRLNRKDFETSIRDVFICCCIAVAGIFLLLLGYIQITICTAMNFARLQERRYYEASDAGEEGVALQQ